MNIRNFDLNLLVIFKELFETSSVSQSAVNLGLSQPAVSHALNRLRQSFDDELFVRTGRNLTPTHKGRTLGSVIGNHIRSLEESLFKDEIWDEKEADVTFTIQGTSYDASIWFPQFMEQLKIEAPTVKTHFRGIVIEDYLDRMIRAEVDLSFAGNLDGFPNFTVETLGEWDMCVIANKSNRNFKKKMSLDSYLMANHVLYTPTEKPGSEVDTLLKQQGKQRNIVVQTSYLSSIPAIVVKRDCLAIVPRFFAEAVKSFYPIKLLELPLDIPAFRHQMVWHKSQDHAKAQMWLRDYIRTNYLSWMKS